MVPKDLKNEFVIGGRRFVAVGFLEAGEEVIDGNEMMRRLASRSLRVIHGADFEHFSRYREDLPEELRPHLLVTDQRAPDCPDETTVFQYLEEAEAWYSFWHNLQGRIWGRSTLVVCCV
jgi:hypothetical protein